MSKQNLVSKAVRLALVCGAASAFGSQAALADDTTTTTTTTTTDQQSTAQLGKIEVTGSRIKRTETETAQPVTVMTSAQIKQTGLATIGAVIQKLTSTGASLSTMDNFGGNFTFTGGGQSTVDLRNLDAKRVLVLVNGKRWATGLDGTVDLNTIPSSVIDHVEVLQDGASSIYGSDAIAGVVNIITVKNYNGGEASAYVGEYNGDSHWDGKTQAYDFTMGSSNDKSGMLFNLSYTNQDGILSKDRAISREPIIGLGNAGGSSAIPNGRFVFVPPNTSPLFASCGGTCDLTFDPATNSFRDFVSKGPKSDRFNYAPFNYVLTPEERYSGFIQGYDDLADNITFKADMMYSHRDSHQQAAPEPLFFASSSITIDIPSTQKYNPFGFDLNAQDPANANLGLLGRRMVENGPRLYHEKQDTFHIDMGFNGYFNAMGGEWDWDANYSFSKDTEIDVNDGHFDVSHLRLALGDAGVCAQVQGCVQLNIFGGAGAINQQMLDYIKYTAQNQFENNQRVYNLDLTNSDLFSLPGGSAGIALGYEQLEHDGFFLPDSVAQNGYDSFNPGRPVLPTQGRETSQAEYVELDMPLLGNMPGIRLLDLDVAGRHTKYDVYGTSNTYQWGLKYQPNNEWLVRTSWSQGFRAPSIQELFSAGTNFSANITDPCDNQGTDPVTKAPIGAPNTPECGVQGVPKGYTQPNAQINTLEIGNRHLQPETSVSRTIGFVYSPDWLAGFNLNMDYYKIDINNVIQPLSGQTILDSCYPSNGAASNSVACGLITRTAFGAVETLKDAIVNAGSITTSGIDANLTYAFPSTAVGDFKLSFDDTHIKSYDLNGIELAGVERGGSVFPFGVPRDKARTALDWVAGPWSAQYALRYVRSMVEESNGAPTGVHIGATTYHDVQGSYDMDSLKTTFTLGIRNLFGKVPPSSTVQELNNFDPTLYDVPGRFVYGRVSVKF